MKFDGERLGRFAARMKDGYDDVIELVDENLGIEKPIILDIKGMKRAGGECARTAQETSELCNLTVTKARSMVDLGLEIKSTLDDMSGHGNKIDASKFALIQDLINGDKMKSAWQLATEMDDIALNCVNQSVKMIDSIEKGIETLPDIFENQIDKNLEHAAKDGHRHGDPHLRDIKPDIDQLQRTVQSIDDVNLFTVMKSGKDAFRDLTTKGNVCYELFDTIRKFAVDVSEVAVAIENFTIGSMIGKMKDLVNDIWRCLRLSDLIRSFAETVGNLIKWIITLFKSVSEKIASIWGGLANAKDCLSNIIHYILDSMTLCDDAKSKSNSFIDTCQDVIDHIKNITKMNTKSVKSIQDLADGDEIKLLIKLATNMDDIVLETIKKIVKMIKEVTNGFDNLPDVIKDGIPEDAGKDDNDPEPVNVDDDINELETTRGDIENANVMETLTVSTDGFNNVREKMNKCQNMINTSKSFADNCNDTIKSFMGVWDIENSMNHLIEIKRLVTLGQMIEQFANEIKRIILATLDVIKTIYNKIKNIDIIPDQLEDAVDYVGDKIQDANIDGHRLKKIGIDGHRINNLGKKINFF